MTIEATSRTRAIETPNQRVPTISQDGATTLLPAPEPLTADLASCAESELYMLIARQRQAAGTAAKGEIEDAVRHAHEARERERAAAAQEKAHRPSSGKGFFKCLGRLVSDFVKESAQLKFGRAVEHAGKNAKDAWNDPKFWKELEKGALVVAKVAGVVAAAAATVASFGAATPVAVIAVAGLCLSSASLAESEGHVLEKLGVDADTAGMIGTGLGIGGALCSGGAGVANLASATASQATWLTTTGRVVGTAGGVVSGTAYVAAGTASLRSADITEAADQAAASRVHEQQVQARFERMVTTLIEALKENDKSTERALDGLTKAMSTKSQTLIISTARA
jgi:hypothetical protein